MSLNRTESGLDGALRHLSQDRTNESAWERLFKSTWPYVFAICSRYLGQDSHTAEDVAQEVFMRIARYAPFGSIRNEASLRRYLKAVAVNRSLSALRKRGSSRTFLDAFSEDEPAGSEDLAGLPEILAILAPRLTPDERRLAWLLAEGKSREEIAGQCEWTMANLSVRLHRLKRKFLKVLSINPL